jgi:hypothetical protein
VKKEKFGKEKARMLSVLRRMIHDLESGYEPDFLCVLYPTPDEHMEALMGFSNDLKSVMLFDKLLSDIKDELKKQYLLDQIGVEPEDFEAAAAQYARDVKVASERAHDRLKKEPAVEDVSAAQELLKKIMARETDSDT